MSAKLLYSLSDDNPNLQKQIGCMNGFLQFFDRHQFINNRSVDLQNTNDLRPGENRHRARGANSSSKKSKEKHPKVRKDTLGNPVESPRVSVSSSSASTTVSSRDYDRTNKREHYQYPVSETIFSDRRSSDCRVNQPCSSPYQPTTQPKMGHQFHKKHTVTDLTSPCLPIKIAPREQVLKRAIKHVDSPRLLQPSKPDSPRILGRNESFRSISSDHSAPAVMFRKKHPDQMFKDAPRFSYDGREKRDSLKMRDLPRLSLDSRQRTMNESACESKEQLVMRRGMQNHSNSLSLLEEPGCFKPPSNIVAKLMGLEDLPDCSPSTKSQIAQDNSKLCRSSDFLSRSSRTIDENKINRSLHSPRSNCREPRTPRSNKGESVVKRKQSTKLLNEPPSLNQPSGNPNSRKAASKHQEVNLEPQTHPLTVYGEIEKRLNDLDFKRSGKDLRALKQILEAMHGEKTKLASRKDIQSSDCASEKSSYSFSYVSQKQGPRKADCPKVIQLTRDMKPTRPVRGSRKEASLVIKDFPLPSLEQIRIGHPVDHIRGVEKTAKHPSSVAYQFRDPTRQTHCTVDKYPAAKTFRLKTQKSYQHNTKVHVTKQANIPETAGTRVRSKYTATTVGSRTKQHKQQSTGLLKSKSSMWQDKDDGSSEFSTDSACLSQGNTNLFVSKNNRNLSSQMNKLITSTNQSGSKHDNLQQMSYKRNADEIPGDMSPKELTIAVREQPSPVSVLDANLFEDESPSPVKKKPTAFRDYETEDLTAEWNDIELTYSPDSMKRSVSYENDCQKLENIKQSAYALRQLYFHPGRNEDSAKPPHKAVNLDKAYVSEILAAAGFLDNLSFGVVKHDIHQSQETIDPHLFFVLEQNKKSRSLSETSNSEANNITKTNEMHQRRLLFDSVNEILSRKLYSRGPASQTQLLLKWLSMPRELMQEICKEIDQLKDNSLDQSFDDEDDFLTTIIGNDMTRGSGNWTDVSSETPSLVLDIERLIFKDLIGELVHDETMKIQSQESECQ